MDPEIAKTQEERRRMEQQLASLTSVTFDTDLYGGNDRDGYVTSIPVNEDDENLDAMDNEVARKLASYTAPKSILKEMPRGGADEDHDDLLGFKKPQRIIDREDDYRKRRLNRVISPERHDAFAAGENTPDPSVRTYADVMREEALKRRRRRLSRGSPRRRRKRRPPPRRRRPMRIRLPRGGIAGTSPGRWDDRCGQEGKTTSDWDLPEETTPGRWDATPTPGRLGDATPSASVGRRNRWDETPTPGDWQMPPRPVGLLRELPVGDDVGCHAKASRPCHAHSEAAEVEVGRDAGHDGQRDPNAGNSLAAAAASFTPGITPMGGVDLATPTPGAINLRGSVTPEQYNLLRWEKDIEERNRPLTDEELDAMFPQEGYKILEPPASYVPIRTPARKLLATPTPLGTPLYSFPKRIAANSLTCPRKCLVACRS
ncbi:hypothetical protein SLA2020_275210 [Shorea laevis]